MLRPWIYAAVLTTLGLAAGPLPVHAQGTQPPEIATFPLHSVDPLGVCQPTVSFDGTLSVPLSGLFDQYFKPGYGASLGIRYPLRPVGPSSGSTVWRPVVTGGFNYTHYDGRELDQINTANNNFTVRSGNSYLGELGFGLERYHATSFGTCVCGAGVQSRLGYLNVDLDNTPFDPNRPTTVVNGDPNRDAFLYGYRAQAWVGVVLNNGWRVQVHGGYGHDWTEAILNRNTSSASFNVGGGVVIPLGARR